MSEKCGGCVVAKGNFCEACGEPTTHGDIGAALLAYLRKEAKCSRTRAANHPAAYTGAIRRATARADRYERWAAHVTELHAAAKS